MPISGRQEVGDQGPEVSHQSKHGEPQMVTQELLTWHPQAPTAGLELCFRPVLSEPLNPVSQQPCTKLIKKIIKLIKKREIGSTRLTGAVMAFMYTPKGCCSD